MKTSVPQKMDHSNLINSVSNSTIPDNLVNQRHNTPIWHYYIKNINDLPLTESILLYIIHSFLKDIIYKTDFKLLALIFKVEFTNSTIRSISRLQIISKGKVNIRDLFINSWMLRNEDYHLIPVKSVIFMYREIKPMEDSLQDLGKQFLPKSTDLSVETNIVSTSNTDLWFATETEVTKNIETLNKYYALSLPKTTNMNNWGEKYSFSSDKSYWIDPQFTRGSKKSNLKYYINEFDDYHIIQIFSHNQLLFTVKDLLSNNDSTFTRIIGNNKYTYVDGKQDTLFVTKRVQFIQPISRSLNRIQSFITMDIETKRINGELIPILISLYDGKNTKSFFTRFNLFDSESISSMIKDAFNYINKRQNNNKRIYFHNLANFDAVFILKTLSHMGDIKPLTRDGRLISIKLKIKRNNQTTTLTILDSYQLLPASLEKLSISFNTSISKGYFPFRWLNTVDLSYIGKVPDYEFYDNLNKNEYDQYIKNYTDNWNLLDELRKYCEKDVLTLYQVISTFSTEIYKLFKVDIIKYPTLSSLTFAIFRANYLKDNVIPKIGGDIYKDISKAYYGGLVDMYFPEGENLYLYDVNSEYPEAMTKALPSGQPVYFEGNIDIYDSESFGFFYCHIKTPDKLPGDMPPLPIKLNKRTICPLGEWNGWYFSEELKDVIQNYNYEVTIIKGYLFKKTYIMKDYIEFLYNIKENTDKKDSKYLIIKFLLNMLYGRFGMSPSLEDNVVLTHKEAEVFYSSNYITDVLDLNNGKELLRFIKIKDMDDNKIFNDLNISVPIAAAVVAYGRMKLNSLKNISGQKVYYSDTDSLIIDKSMNSELVGKKLGQLKLEAVIKKGLFLMPKVYALWLINDKTVVKIKGLKTALDFVSFNQLLYKDTKIYKEQEKWYKLWDRETISIRREIYTLTVTDNKRQLIFDSSNKLVSTRPFIVRNGNILNNKPDYIYNISEPIN